MPTVCCPHSAGHLGVVFAYAAINWWASRRETAEPAKIMPRAIQLCGVAHRASVRSTVLLAPAAPYTAYKEHVGPFVTFFSRSGIDAAGSVMNLVV